MRRDEDVARRGTHVGREGQDERAKGKQRAYVSHRVLKSDEPAYGGGRDVASPARGVKQLSGLWASG